ncbi:MAG: HAD-IA family hydrolase [Hyphomicrobium sp.]
MKLLVFDCDGTIVDSQAGIVLSMDHAFRTLGLEPPARKATLSVVGLSLPEAFSVLAPDQDVDVRRKLADRYKSAFRDLDRDPNDGEIMFPGAKTVIEALAGRDDVVLGVATGKSRRGVERLFEREGWMRHFATIQTADDHPSKPNPSMLHQAMRETGALPHQTVMIGDTTYDIEMARAANVHALGVTWGYHLSDELAEAGAHKLIDAYGDLPAAVDTLLQGRAATS